MAKDNGNPNNQQPDIQPHLRNQKTQEPDIQRPTERITIWRPKFEVFGFDIFGPRLVVHRFSEKLKEQMLQKAEAGTKAATGLRKSREPRDTLATFNAARYISKEGWDGFHAGSIRNAMVDACRLVNFKMTLAKLSIFVVADGNDKDEPQIPLIRIIGKAALQKDFARTSTGEPYITIRAVYVNWKARVRIRWDVDQFTREDVANLLFRVGQQVGICEGRPFSPESCGVGDWGTFNLVGMPSEELPVAA